MVSRAGIERRVCTLVFLGTVFATSAVLTATIDSPAAAPSEHDPFFPWQHARLSLCPTRQCSPSSLFPETPCAMSLSPSLLRLAAGRLRVPGLVAGVAPASPWRLALGRPRLAPRPGTAAGPAGQARFMASAAAAAPATTPPTLPSGLRSPTDEDIAAFRAMLPTPGSVITDADTLAPHNADWMGRFTGCSRVLLKPRSTDEVAAILRHCNEHGIPLVPQGGNTGLVGGSVPVADEVILSLAGMASIEAFDAASGVVTAQAGVVLEALDEYVGERGHRVPLDLGAKGSCQIGGNVATNAGGSRYVRYGSLRASVLGVEAVLPSGEVLAGLTSLRKDNTGYDLKQLMIGGEGTLGVITRVALACPPLSAAVHVTLLKVPSWANAVSLLAAAKGQLAEILSAFEFMDAPAVKLAVTHLSHVRDPLGSDEGEAATDGPFYVLIETAGSSAAHDREKLDAFLESSMESELVTDGVVAESAGQAAAFWELRESLPEAVGKAGTKTFKYDVSLPMDVFYRLVTDARARLADAGADADVVGWGHMGDGNLHLNVAARGDVAAVAAALEPWVYEQVAAARGSVSAEHGLGVMKAGAIGYSKDAVSVGVMRGIKALLDPKGILNPLKMLPRAGEEKTA